MKRICILISCMLVCSTVYSQSKFSWDRVVLGGNFGAGFSTRESSVAVSPTVGYRLTERFTAGIGGIYQYYQYKDNVAHIDVQFNNYGGKVFGSYLLTPFLLAYSEYEVLNFEHLFNNPLNGKIDSKRSTIGSWFVGGGYRQEFGQNSSFDIMVLFNLTETAYTPYSNPVIRFGIGLGL